MILGTATANIKNLLPSFSAYHLILEQSPKLFLRFVRFFPKKSENQVSMFLLFFAHEWLMVDRKGSLLLVSGSDQFHLWSWLAATARS